jgi:hypothetical protein
MPPKITMMPNGLKAGVPSPVKSTPDHVRGACAGWTKNAARRNRDFLLSVETDALDGLGWTYTLTVKRLPRSPEEWASMRNVLFKRLRRLGVIRLHWVTEFTKKNRPHLHLAVFFDGSNLFAPLDVCSAWVEIARHLGSRPIGQLGKPMSDAAGWFAYTSKHVSRGVQHYQRQQDSLPPSWRSSGRMWGKLGHWETSQDALTLSWGAYHRLRRLCRSWALSEARAALLAAWDPNAEKRALRRISQARRMLKCSDLQRSALIGLGHWIPREVHEQLVAAAASSPGDVRAAAPGRKAQHPRPPHVTAR